jgi:hypothetical protein
MPKSLQTSRTFLERLHPQLLRGVSDGWANTHLARHMDFLARRELALDTLIHHLDKEME